MIASHNSLTFLKPKYKIFNIFTWRFRRQNVDIYEQYKYNIKGYDFRVCIDKNNKPVITYGIIKFNGDIKNYLSFLNQKSSNKNRIYIQLVNENEFYNSDKNKFETFALSCVKKYKNLTFNVVKSSKKWTNDFYTSKKLDHHHYDSCRSYRCFLGRSLFMIIPKEYAILNNEYNKNLPLVKDNDDLFWFDFVNIG